MTVHTASLPVNPPFPVSTRYQTHLLLNSCVLFWYALAWQALPCISMVPTASLDPTCCCCLILQIHRPPTGLGILLEPCLLCLVNRSDWSWSLLGLSFHWHQLGHILLNGPVHREGFNLYLDKICLTIIRNLKAGEVTFPPFPEDEDRNDD